jgi:hypothetical protein
MQTQKGCHVTTPRFGEMKAWLRNVLGYLATFRVKVGGKRYAGHLLLSIGRTPHGDSRFYLHLFVRPQHWQLGYVHDYDEIQSWGLGPVFLFVWG